MASKVYDLVTAKILDTMSKGVIPWWRPWSALRPMNISGREYRGINLLLLSCMPYSDCRYLTFHQAKKLDGRIKRGEHGHIICLWKFVESDENSVKKTLPILRYYTVFNVEQCEGLNLPPMSTNALDFQPIEAAAAIGKDWTDQPIIKHQGFAAAYRRLSDEIVLPQPEAFGSAEDYYATRFHEVVHATGHWDRLKRFGPNDVLHHEAYAKEELVAEIGSSFLLAEAHIDSDKLYVNSAAYISGWMKKIADDPKLIVSAAGRAQKAVDMVMGRIIRQEESEDAEPAEVMVAA